jgi:hypothetical protein
VRKGEGEKEGRRIGKEGNREAEKDRERERERESSCDRIEQSKGQKLFWEANVVRTSLGYF